MTEVPLHSESPEDKKEQILFVLNEALNKSEIRLVVGESDEFVVFPLEIDSEKGDLFIETEYGAQWVEISKIKKAELVEVADKSVPEQLTADATKAMEEEKHKDKNLDELREKVEGIFEKIPTKEEIFNVVGVDAEKCSITKEQKDYKGLYYFEFKIEGKEEGESIEYGYMREGDFDTHKSGRTSIIETVYDKDGGFVKYPEHIATYEGGEWISVK